MVLGLSKQPIVGYEIVAPFQFVFPRITQYTVLLSTKYVPSKYDYDYQVCMANE